MGNGCMKKPKVVETKARTIPTFKVVVVGDSGSGKTSVIRRFVENRFDQEYQRTTDIVITSVVRKLNVPEHAIVTVELWDVPGQNDVDLRKTYYLDVDAVIVVVDISQSDSLQVAGSWSLDVAEHARKSRTFTENIPNPDGKTVSKKIRKEYLKPKNGSIPILLLGNKYDLAKSQFQETQTLASSHTPENSSPERVDPVVSPKPDSDTANPDVASETKPDSNGRSDSISDVGAETPVSANSQKSDIMLTLPPCVDEIERVAEKFGFLTGIPVSAKTSNGGVTVAIQSLLRRLVAKEMPNAVTPVRTGSKLTNSEKTAKRRDQTQLQAVGIIEIDDVILRCTPIVQEAEEMTTSYAEAVRSFRNACLSNGLVKNPSPSLDVCVSGLKRSVERPFVSTDPRLNIRQMSSEEETKTRRLVCSEEDPFPNLRVDSEEDGIDSSIRKVLSEYRENLFVWSALIMKRGNDVEALLTKFVSEIAEMREKAWESTVQENARKVATTLAQNEARIRGTRDLIRDTTVAVQSSVGRIKAALLF